MWSYMNMCLGFKLVPGDIDLNMGLGLGFKLAPGDIDLNMGLG